jgi:hypothetical protein
MFAKGYDSRRLKFFLLDNTIADLSEVAYEKLFEVMKK